MTRRYCLRAQMRASWAAASVSAGAAAGAHQQHRCAARLRPAGHSPDEHSRLRVPTPAANHDGAPHLQRTAHAPEHRSLHGPVGACRGQDAWPVLHAVWCGCAAAHRPCNRPWSESTCGRYLSAAQPVARGLWAGALLPHLERRHPFLDTASPPCCFSSRCATCGPKLC